MKKFKIKSFCKINLSLRVLKKLKNGYHSIESLVTFCDLFDVISISKINRKKDKISFSGDFKRGINLKSNTITKVLHLLRKGEFLQNHVFKINIKKNIPHGSGLGGGSANAADILNFLNSKMNLRLNRKELEKIACKVGFDVPLSLERKNTFISGKLGKIVRYNSKFLLNVLIVYPNIISSTKRIYEKSKKFNPLKSNSKFDIKNRKKLIILLKKEDNDLQKVVVKYYPKVRKIINIIKEQNGCYFSRITGSGSACIGIFSNVKNAIYAKKLIKLKFPKYWCVVSKTI
ncbi:4-(cytidine 5'-diphospho)-2-C-methyl-D-erythritol kinase [Pelagibacteraceae bacterium]|nr:4-(cytidine 5'-diphospho)-2-C-methyl-D-erythritol kinase [Pelagibacteraceae bacterium]